MSSFRRVVLIGILTATGLLSAQEVQCSSYHGGLPLYLVAVFDGPPEQLASLIPDHRHQYDVWDVGYIFDASRSLYLVCHYGREGKEQVVTVKAEKKVQRCTFRNGATNQPGKLICK